eukprot:scaffold18751_cov245-Isochrysis_galbana.AAC.9
MAKQHRLLRQDRHRRLPRVDPDAPVVAHRHLERRDLAQCLEHRTLLILQSQDRTQARGARKRVPTLQLTKEGLTRHPVLGAHARWRCAADFGVHVLVGHDDTRVHQSAAGKVRPVALGGAIEAEHWQHGGSRRPDVHTVFIRMRANHNADDVIALSRDVPPLLCLHPEACHFGVPAQDSHTGRHQDVALAHDAAAEDHTLKVAHFGQRIAWEHGAVQHREVGRTRAIGSERRAHFPRLHTHTRENSFFYNSTSTYLRLLNINI